MVALVRRQAGPDESSWDPSTRTIDPDALEGCDAVVNLAGVGIGDRRWTTSRKRAIIDSRVAATTLLCETASHLEQKPSVVVSASAIGYYGDRGDEILTEESSPGSVFPSEICKAWEAATAAAERSGIRVVHLRTAVVLARHGGALARQLPLFRLALGGRLGRGDQWLSWISLRDEVRAIIHAMREPSLSGAVNASSPAPVSNAEFTASLAQVVHRPAFLTVPRPALRLALGRELADEAVLCSLRVLPSRLEESGFTFCDPSIGEALSSVLAG